MAMLTLGMVGGLIWWTDRAPNDPVARVEVSEEVKAVGTAGTTTGTFARVLPGDVLVTIPAAGGTEDRLSTFLSSARRARTMVVLDRTAFISGSAVLKPESRSQIASVARILKAYPDARVTVGVHTDNSNYEATNQALSRAQANEIAGKLIQAGVPFYRVLPKGYGGLHPIADNSTEEGRSQSRRVVLEVAVR